MRSSAEVAVLGAVAAVSAFLLAGVYVVAVLDEAARVLIAGVPLRPRAVLLRPVQQAALLAVQRPTITERPDLALWLFAPAAYGGLAALALAVVPFSPTLAVADVRTGIVVFGSAEMLLMVAVYLHGWSANSVFPLLGAYRFVAMALSFLLLQMFVLIAAALPAESLAVGPIIEAQRGAWHVLTQPLGLPLFLVVALGAAFWGPLNTADAADVAGGTSAEVAGPQRLAWELGRRAVLVTYAAMTASVFLGGYLGPGLPGPAWLAAKTLLVLMVLVGMGHLLARVRIQWFVTVAWVVLLPLSFVDLAIAGVVAL